MLQSSFNGEVMVFVNEHNGRKFYKVGISKKMQDGNYQNGYVDVQFKKDIILENKAKINIKSAWLTFYMNKENITVPYIFINEFEQLDNTQLDNTQLDNTQFVAGLLPF